jgi:hypothetical protein
MSSLPSLCIPRVFANITEARVAFVIRDVGLGEIDHIDMVPKVSEDGTKFQRVFIHFKKWSASETAQRARERVLSGKEIKIVYDDPWFWKLSANRSVARSESSRPVKPQNSSRPRPRLVDDDEASAAALLSKKSFAGRKPRVAALRVPSPDMVSEVFTPSSPVDPPPSDSPPVDSHPVDSHPVDSPDPRMADSPLVDSPPKEAAWTKVDYGNLPKPKKQKRVVKVVG